MTAAVDVRALKSLTDLSQVTALLQDVLAKERAIQVELEQRLTHRKDMETEFLSLTAATSDMLELGRADAQQLAASVSTTAQKAQEVSRRVRLLDTSQANLVATLETIDLVITRSDCVAGVRAALDEGDYERAAEHVQTYQQLEKEAGMNSYVEEQAAEHAAILNQARDQLLGIVRTKVREAMDILDVSTALRFIKLHKPLDLPDEGLRTCTQLLRSVCHAKALEEYGLLAKRIEADPTNCDFLAALSNTLRTYYACLREHEALIAETFGAEKIVAVTLDLLQDVNAQGTRVLKRFLEHRGIARMIKDVSSAPAAAAAAPVDPVLVDAILLEMRALSACSQEFSACVVAAMQKALAPKPLPADAAEALKGGAFGAALAELQSQYVALEAYYMENCLAKAIAIDTVLEGSMMSSMLDDSFFVLKTSVERALTAGSLQPFISVLSRAAALLLGPFRAAVQAKLSGCGGRVMELVLADSPDTVALEAAAAPLNNAVLCVGYVSKMHESLEAEALARFQNPMDYEVVKSALQELSAAGADLDTVSKRACDNLAECILSAMRPALERLSKLSCNLTDAEYAALEMEEGWARPLCATLEGQWERLQPYLAPDAKNEVMAAVLSRVLQRIEATLAPKKFNMCGGLLLDKEVRSLVNHLTEITGLPVRDQSHRLRQMVTILTLESLDELADAWENDGLTWRLTAGEVKTLLLQRVDFDRQKIAALVL